MTTLRTQMRFRVTNTREEHRKYDKGDAPLIEDNNGSENMELRMIPKTNENGGGYLPHMSEWFAIEIKLVDGPKCRCMVTHPAGVIVQLQDLATRTDIEECNLLAWDALTGTYTPYDLDSPMISHSSTSWEVVE